MTNLQAQEPKSGLEGVLTREVVLLGVPVLVGGLAALATVIGLALPSWQRLQNDQALLVSLQDLSRSVPQLRRKIDRAEKRHRDALVLQSRLMSMIAGSGDISTFMTQIGAEASRSGVELDSYDEPSESSATGQPEASPAPPGAPPKASKAQAQPDPLQAAGLTKTSLLITAHGPAPNLLTFLRRLETLSLLVVQSDLSLKQEAGVAPAGAKVEGTLSTTTLKLRLTLYSKQISASPATASPGTTSPGTASSPPPPTPARS
jgi:type IV pilus assembly protein PilO